MVLLRILIRPVIAIVLAYLLWGCSTPLSVNEVRDILTKHFETRQYRVLVLEIGTIGGIPLGELKYMGTEGYSVEIRSLTLEVTADAGEPWNYRKGQRLTFTNATVRIRKSTDAAGWIVTALDGIPVR